MVNRRKRGGKKSGSIKPKFLTVEILFYLAAFVYFSEHLVCGTTLGFLVGEIS